MDRHPLQRWTGKEPANLGGGERIAWGGTFVLHPALVCPTRPARSTVVRERGAAEWSLDNVEEKINIILKWWGIWGVVWNVLLERILIWSAESI